MARLTAEWSWKVPFGPNLERSGRNCRRMGPKFSIAGQGPVLESWACLRARRRYFLNCRPLTYYPTNSGVKMRKKLGNYALVEHAMRVRPNFPPRARGRWWGRFCGGNCGKRGSLNGESSWKSGWRRATGARRFGRGKRFFRGGEKLDFLRRMRQFWEAL